VGIIDGFSFSDGLVPCINNAEVFVELSLVVGGYRFSNIGEQTIE
jgi:hypothetical protein